MIKLLLLGIILLGFTNCSSNHEAEMEHSSELNACVERGVTYFKEIGSYPTLNSEPNVGRKAEDVANERCNRTYTAF